ncbi:MAG: hypothetical protein ACYSW3_26280 [Planctomycetota bacterium]
MTRLSKQTLDGNVETLIFRAKLWLCSRQRAERAGGGNSAAR